MSVFLRSVKTASADSSFIFYDGSKRKSALMKELDTPEFKWTCRLIFDFVPSQWPCLCTNNWLIDSFMQLFNYAFIYFLCICLFVCITFFIYAFYIYLIWTFSKFKCLCIYLSFYLFVFLFIYLLWCLETIKCKILHATIQQSDNSLKKWCSFLPHIST